MYNHIESILVDQCRIAVKLEHPVWMTSDGQEVQDELDGFGCNVTIKFERPDMGLVLDECGCNFSQESDSGNRSNQLLVTGVNDNAYDTISTKHNHFSVLGITRLDGVVLMCVIIIMEKSIALQWTEVLIPICWMLIYSQEK